TYWSGKQAGDAVNVPAMANLTLSEHADWALYTIWFFGIYGLARLLFLWKKLSQKWIVSFVIFLVGAGGMALLYETAEHGAELVFRHGVGVQAAEQARQALAEKQEVEAALAEGGINIQENGSWQWNPGHGAEIILREQFKWLAGSPEGLNAATIHDEANDDVLAIDARNNTAFFTAGRELKSVQADVKLNLDQFQGAFLLVHHIQDSLNYDFISLVKDAPGENIQMKLGRVTGGEENVEEQGPAQTTGWFTLRAVGEGRHFRGYADEKLIVHGHADELPPGPVGFLVRGSGRILIDEISVLSLR
ncbi:MAG: hypothetical protein KDE62_17035, partial [Calditrichaeota bacterium]|nr:hypothetical protein [Calditrichota bacterium]